VRWHGLCYTLTQHDRGYQSIGVNRMTTGNLKKILIMDDEPSILLSLSYALQADGVEVISCSELEQAEEALENTRFDLVLADIRMSGINGVEGLELLSYVRRRYDTTDVIIMTGYNAKEIEAEAYRRGAAHYFVKPVDILELLRKVSQLGIPVKASAVLRNDNSSRQAGAIC